MTDVEGLGTRVNFPDYIARRPALAMAGCKQLGEVIRHHYEEGHEMPFVVPPFSVLMYIEMINVIKELAPEGVVFRIEVPDAVARWMR